jgi:hypothetical protein
MKVLLSPLTRLLIFLNLFFLMIWISQDMNRAEWWVRMISPWYSRLLGPLISLIPFSITELMWGTFFLWILILIGKMIRNLKQKSIIHVAQHGIMMLQTVSLLGATYMATTGIAYQRAPVAIPGWKTPVSSSDFTAIVTYFQEDFNHVSSQLRFDEKGSIINPYDLKTIENHIVASFDAYSTDYFHDYSPRIKPMLLSFLYTEFHITGMHFGLSTEALFNANIPAALLPFTMAHELAHAKGVMREQDANLVAMYMCLSSEDPYIRYSGYFNTFYALLHLLRYVGDDQAYARTYQQFTPEIKNDYRYQGTFWDQYTLLDDLARWINDVYLRIMGNDGVTSYVDVPTTGTVVENGQTIEVITQFSPYQQLYFYLFNA